jgi:hypothetical protein
MDFASAEAHTPTMLRFRSLLCRSFASCSSLPDSALPRGISFDALGLAAFFFFVASIDAKPAWKFWFDPVKGANGRSTMARAAEPNQPAHPRGGTARA